LRNGRVLSQRLAIFAAQFGLGNGDDQPAPYRTNWV